MKLSVIIVTYHSMRLIKDCIDSLLRYNSLPEGQLEIIVVDNSSEEEGEKLKKFLIQTYGGLVRFIKNENLGYGHGNNVGIRAATGNIIGIMNPDVRLTEPLFDRVEHHFFDQETVSVGFQQKNGSTDYSFFIKPEYFLPVVSSIKLKRANKQQNFDAKKYYLSGALVFFRKKDMEEAGLYDEEIFMYFEEPDIAHRLAKHGKKTIFDPSRSYFHMIEVKDEYNIKLLDIGTQSIKIYFRKYGFDLKKYIKLRLLELKIYKLYFWLTGNKLRSEMAAAYTNSLRTLIDEK